MTLLTLALSMVFLLLITTVKDFLALSRVEFENNPLRVAYVLCRGFVLIFTLKKVRKKNHRIRPFFSIV